LGSAKVWLRVGLASLAAVVVISVATAAGSYLALGSRLHKVAVNFPAGGSGQTWVIVGSDSRADEPAGPNVYGSQASIPGQRADVVLVIHQDGAHTSVLSVPRDLLVNPAHGQVERLALTLNTGPQSLINGLCTTLGIAATHFVMVDMNAFVQVADAEGGVTVDIPYAMRDRKSGLDLATAGPIHLDGTQLLALVRSRQAQILVNGTWQAESSTAGASSRTQWAGRALQALGAGAQHASPIEAMHIAWALSGGTTLDTHTSPLALRSLARTDLNVVDLPVQTGPNAPAAVSSAATKQAIAAAGMGAHCQSA
jgi:LCP family protein required for cell wall assembly